MSINKDTSYDLGQYVAEIYDQSECYTDDIELIRRLLGRRSGLRILEPFCGTGRISIPLAQAGNTVVGIDKSKAMLGRFRQKLGELPEGISQRIELIEADVIDTPWPRGFDLVVLGGNCFYELATAEEQECCIKSAANSLKENGYVYIDNDHMEGTLDESWQDIGVVTRSLAGTTCDGTEVTTTRETIWFNVEKRLARLRRCATAIKVDGKLLEHEFIQQKHPVSAVEVASWLEKHHFKIKGQFGDRHGSPYTPESGRAIFWAHLQTLA